jgi:hypothetical protein
MRLVYIHIGKTGGTSLRHTLQAAGLRCTDGFVQTRMTEAEAAHYDAFDAICGHISRADQVKWFPDRKVITILRSPIDRCLSFIHYVRSLNGNGYVPLHVKSAKEMTTMELINTPGAQVNLYNTMVRQLGGHMLDRPAEADFPVLFERAKQTLREAMWVGFNETMGSDISRLAKIVGAPLCETRENVTPERPPMKSEDPGLLNRLLALNQFDLQLYRWAKRQRR